MSKIIVQGIHVEVTDAIENHAKEQFSKVLEHFQDHISNDLIVKISVNSHHAHLKTASVNIPVIGSQIVIEEVGDSMYSLITMLSNKAERQLRKVKDKKQIKSGIDKNLIEE